MRKKLFVLCVIAIATALLLTACAGVDLTLTFEVDGEVYATVNTMGQEAIQMPKDPEKEGYAFDGWYWDKDVWEKPFTANSLLETPLSENMIVYAKWKLKAETHEHAYGEWEVVTPATCTVEGLQKHACTVCGEEETEAIPKLAHNYGEWTVVTPATCIAEGLQKHVCSVCEEEESEAIPTVPHTYGEWEVITPATCTAEGFQKHACTVCGEEETEAIPKLAHNYGEWMVITPATCTAEGLQKHDCTVCGEEETEAIPKLAHNYGEWTVVTPATCIAEGLQKHACTVCGEEETEVIQKLPHTYETRHDAANHWSECSVCYETVDFTAHTFGEWIAVIPASCTAEGLQKRECACGAEQTEIIQIVAHSYKVKHDATNHWQECSVCHEKISETAHAFGEWSVVTAATCTTEGQKKHVCSVCNAEEAAVIPVAAHSYATQYDDDNHWKECSVCGDVIDSGAHTYENEVCTVCGRVYGTKGLKYYKIAGGYEVMGIETTCSNTKIEIPSRHEGQPVIAIGWGAFWDQSSLTSIVIPDSVTSIGSSAFWECSSLTSIAIPDSVTSIGYKAFDGSGIWNNAADNSVVYADKWAVGYKGTINEVTLKADTVGIGDVAFDECRSLKSIAIPNGVTCISSCAFRGCSGLTSIAISDSVTSIGDSAFNRCSSLTSIAIPDSVTSIDIYAFRECSSLTNILIPNGVTSIGDSVFSYCSSLTNILIPNGVTSIGDSAFSDCSSLTSIEIPNSVTSISTSAFTNCSGLETISVAGGNPKYYSVSNCIIDRETKTLVLGCKNSIIPTDGSVTSIGDYAFSGCSDLQSILIPNGVTSIGNLVFYGCSSLQSIAIPNGVTSIGYRTFFECSSLTSIEIPNSVTSIGSEAFYRCSNLTGIAIPNGVTSIGYQAFQECSSLTSIAIPDSVTDIGNRALAGCNSLQSITIPFVGAAKDEASDTYFGYLFGATSSDGNSTYVPAALTEVIVTGGTSIGDYAFSWCSSLTSIAIPNGVTSIGNYAFYGCNSLTIYTEAAAKPSGWESIGCPVVWDYKNNDVADDGYIYTIQNGIRYALKDGAAVVVRQPSNITEANIATEIIYKDTRYSVTSIGYSAFSGCSSLTSITIPNSVTSIGTYAFNGCSSLTKVEVNDIAAWCGIEFGNSDANPLYYANHLYISGVEVTELAIPVGVTSIGSYAFWGCHSLTSIAIPVGVTSIGYSAFWECHSLTSIAIPDSVTSIGSNAFQYCRSLTSITYQGMKEEWKAITKESGWNDYTGNYTVTCTDGTLSKSEA